MGTSIRRAAAMAALAVILSNHGVVPVHDIWILPNADRTVLLQHHDEHLTTRQAAPDSPPPRS